MVEQLQHLGCGQAFAAGLGGARRRCAVPLRTARPAPCRPPARPRSSRRLGASVEPAATPLRWQRQRQRRANSGAPLRHGPCPRPTKHQPLPRYYRQAGQAHHQKAAQQRATDPLIAPRRGLRKIAAQHHRHAQHQPMRVGSACRSAGEWPLNWAFSRSCSAGTRRARGSCCGHTTLPPRACSAPAPSIAGTGRPRRTASKTSRSSMVWISTAAKRW